MKTSVSKSFKELILWRMILEIYLMAERYELSDMKIIACDSYKLYNNIIGQKHTLSN